MNNKKSVNKKAIVVPSVIGIAVVAIALVLFFVMQATVSEVDKNTIANNIYIGSVNVSGMTKQEAKAELDKEVENYQKETILLSAEDSKEEVTLKELGFEIENAEEAIEEALAYGKEGFIWKRYKLLNDLETTPVTIDVEYGVDEKDIKDMIASKVTFAENQAQNATIKREGGKFVITDGKRGKKVEVDESIKVIQEYFDKEWDAEKENKISLVTVLDEPDITREDLEGITATLGTYSTYYGTNDNRGKNIVNATKKLNGVILMPGDEYSVEKAMKPFTAANGYYAAGSYLNGKVVQSLGGGVCQVSTTLYNALILAELEITERHAHSMVVGYVSSSMDAAIAEDVKDLKFKNNTDSPIYIEGITSGGRVAFTVYGKETRSQDRKVSFVSQVLSKTAAPKKFVASGASVGTLKLKESGHDAIKAKLWKVVTENGKEVSRTVFNTSSYRSSAATYEVGIGTDNAEAKKVVQNAIATQNEATIRAAIAQAKSIIAAAQKPATPPTEPTTPPTEGTQTP